MIPANFQFLIASKSRLLRYKISEPLLSEGFTIYEATSSREVIAQLAEIKNGAMILGEHLTDMDAVPFLQVLKEANLPQWPKVILVGTEQPDVVVLRESGVRYFLFPPLLPMKILLKAKAVLDPSESTANERNTVESELRKYQRISVHGLHLHLFEPVREIVPVRDMSYCGLRITSENLVVGHQGNGVKMQLVFKGKTLIAGVLSCGCVKARLASVFPIPSPLVFMTFSRSWPPALKRPDRCEFYPDRPGAADSQDLKGPSPLNR